MHYFRENIPPDYRYCFAVWPSICCYKNISIVWSSYKYALYVKHVFPLLHHTSFPCDSSQPQTPCVMKLAILLPPPPKGWDFRPVHEAKHLSIFWNVIALCFEVDFFSSLLHGIWSIFLTSTSPTVFLISPSVFSKDVWPPGHFHDLISQLFHLIKKYQIFH